MRSAPKRFRCPDQAALAAAGRCHRAAGRTDAAIRIDLVRLLDKRESLQHHLAANPAVWATNGAADLTRMGR